MKPRSCSHLHFVQAIRAGVVVKVRNVDSSGRPALVFKKLEDIYEREDAKKRDSLSTLQPQDRRTDIVFDSDRIKTENTCLPSIERKTKKRESNTDTSYRDSDDDEEGTDGLNSGKMTLKQLKEQCKKKKRKILHSACLSPKQDCTDQQPEENECDLQEPISSWKSKLPKIPKGKKKRAKKCASLCSQTEVSVKSAQIPSAEDALQYSGYLSAPVNVKVEVSETEYPECSNMMSISDDTSNCSIEPLVLCGEVLDEILQPVQPEVDLGEEISLTEDESRNCAVNEICFDHLEPIEPNYLLPSIVGEIMEADNLKKTCQRSLVFPALEKEEGHTVHPPLEESSVETIFHFDDQGSDICNNLEINSSVHERSSQISGVCGVQVPDMAMDSSLCCVGLTSGHFQDDINGSLPPNLEMDSLSSPLSKYDASWNSNHCSSPEVVLVSADDDSFATEKPPLMSDSVDEARNYLSPHKNPVSSEGVLSTEEEKQPLMFSPDCAESNSSERSHPFDVGVKSSMPEIMSTYNLEQYHPPERLLSTRKAISPISQEKLRQAMKGSELNDKIDNYKCKDKLQFMIETENNASPAGPDTDGAQVNSNPEGLGEVTRTLVAMSSKQMNKKPRTERKGSPHKGFRRGPHLSGSLPQVSTGATSIQSCSERAIAFSQRQMHDIEGLAMKLMQELKFMKDIVEGQVHSEASPAKFLKYDVDEVKTGIKSATKVEETTKKWLSMMARDCNRFCKLMRLNEKGEIAPGNAIHRERKKITFADEAGGVLCHVKFIDDSKDSLDSKS